MLTTCTDELDNLTSLLENNAWMRRLATSVVDGLRWTAPTTNGEETFQQIRTIIEVLATAPAVSRRDPAYKRRVLYQMSTLSPMSKANDSPLAVQSLTLSLYVFCSHEGMV